MTLKAQRLRLRFRLTGPGAALGHRDLLNAWEEACKAGGLAVAYSEGKRPAPQISIGALLPMSVTSDCELIDVFLAERAEPGHALESLRARLPDGVAAVSVEETGVGGPSLQSQVRWAEYEVIVSAEGTSRDELQARIDRLLAAETWPAEYRREAKVREYDLRPLVYSLSLADEREGAFVLLMLLRAEQEMTGRADQVVLALGLPQAAAIHRTRLHIEENQPALLAYRKAGEPEGE